LRMSVGADQSRKRGRSVIAISGDEGSIVGSIDDDDAAVGQLETKPW
jgi:hypothetical protein